MLWNALQCWECRFSWNLVYWNLFLTPTKANHCSAWIVSACVSQPLVEVDIQNYAISKDVLLGWLYPICAVVNSRIKPFIMVKPCGFAWFRKMEDAQVTMVFSILSHACLRGFRRHGGSNLKLVCLFRLFQHPNRK